MRTGQEHVKAGRSQVQVLHPSLQGLAQLVEHPGSSLLRRLVDASYPGWEASGDAAVNSSHGGASIVGTTQRGDDERGVSRL